MSGISDEKLLTEVLSADDMLISEDVSPSARSLRVVMEVMKRLGFDHYVIDGSGRHPLVDRISHLHAALYRRSDLRTGGVHSGVFMFRDIFGRITIPMIYGSPRVDLLTLVDFSENQKMLMSQDQSALSALVDQLIDVFDFAGLIVPFGSYETPTDDVLARFRLAGLQSEAAAAVVCNAYDMRGAIQSALISAELSLKAALFHFGVADAELPKFGHRLDAAATELAKRAEIDLERIKRVVADLPRFVENRYSVNQPTRVETGHIVMKCQFICGESARSVSKHTLRNDLATSVPRYYP